MQARSEERRVVITGMGAVTSLGHSVNATWDGVLNGRSGVDFIRQFDSRAFPVRIGSEVAIEQLESVPHDWDGPPLGRTQRSTLWEVKVEPASENPKFDGEPIWYRVANGQGREDVVRKSIKMLHIFGNRCSICDQVHLWLFRCANDGNQ